MKNPGILLSLFILTLLCQRGNAQTCTGTAKRNITVEICTATANPLAAAVQIFPNPASDFFVVKNEGQPLFFELFDLFGQKILLKKLDQETSTRIDTYDIPAGIYLATWYASPLQKACFTRLEICR